MATLEERFNALADDYAAAIQQVVTKLDEHGAMQREHGRNIREVGRDLCEVKARLATVDVRLNRMDERLDTLSEETRSLKTEMNQKFDQVIALLLPASKGDA